MTSIQGHIQGLILLYLTLPLTPFSLYAYSPVSLMDPPPSLLHDLVPSSQQKPVSPGVLLWLQAGTFCIYYEHNSNEASLKKETEMVRK